MSTSEAKVKSERAAVRIDANVFEGLVPLVETVFWRAPQDSFAELEVHAVAETPASYLIN